VTFAPGSATITPAMEAHLTRVADFLRRAPAVGFKLTPKASDGDVRALKVQEVSARLERFKSERGLRDLARQRMRLVQHRSSLITSVQNQVWRSLAVRLRSETIKGRGKQPWPEISDPDLALSVKAGRAAIDTLTVQIERLEKLILKRVDRSARFRMLKTVTGIGPILAMTIALEVGDIGRFAGVGEFASYCRCVDSQRLSNGKKKGEANRKCGNRYLAWAFMEAAHFAIRNLPAAKRFYERKRRQRHALLAVKALAHKLARACFYVLRDQVPFAPERLFV